MHAAAVVLASIKVNCFNNVAGHSAVSPPEIEQWTPVVDAGLVNGRAKVNTKDESVQAPKANLIFSRNSWRQSELKCTTRSDASSRQYSQNRRTFTISVNRVFPMSSRPASVVAAGYCASWRTKRSPCRHRLRPDSTGRLCCRHHTVCQVTMLWKSVRYSTSSGGRRRCDRDKSETGQTTCSS